MPLPTPTVSRADVERVVRRDYPAEQFARVLAMLDGYKDLNGRECDRTQLAALMLAGGSVENLAGVLQACDYRELLAAAEYPHYLRTLAVPPSERQGIIDADWAHYSEWLYRP